jgi:3alpha(or 20beta)-hydroxysteroid dehydrogenase
MRRARKGYQARGHRGRVRELGQLTVLTNWLVKIRLKDLLQLNSKVGGSCDHGGTWSIFNLGNEYEGIMDRLKGKVAIVTGAARGMGEHHARLMASLGAKVVLTDIQEKQGDVIANEIGPSARFMRHDVARADDWKRVVSETEKLFGNVNVLVNNAGIASATPFDELTAEAFARFISVNSLGVLLGMQAVAPSMKRAMGGSIINISSVAGKLGAKGAMAYTASKFAVTGMTKTAALDLAEFGIRVNSIHPGLILTPLLLSNKEYLDLLLQRVPLGRGARPEELSGLAVFLASDESSYCTGAEFVADGGLTCQQ